MLRKININETTEILKEISVYGFCLVKNLILKKNSLSLLRKIKKIYKDSKIPTTRLKGLPKRDSRDLRIYNLPNKDKIFIDLITNKEFEKILIPLINDPYYRFLPSSVPNYFLNSFTARSSGYALDLHIDSMIPFQGSYPLSILVLIVLEDMYEENGCTIVVPGSHQSGKYTDRSLKNIKKIEASAGDVLFMDSRTWHGTTENKTQNSRWLINSLYSQWWLKPQIDIVNSLKAEIFNKLNNKQKQLLGYCSIPPLSELERVNTKCGYDYLKKL
jgi:hypothetical protein